MNANHRKQQQWSYLIRIMSFAIGFDTEAWFKVTETLTLKKKPGRTLGTETLRH